VPERTKIRAPPGLVAPRPPPPGPSHNGSAHSLQRAPPPPAGPPRNGVPAPPPGRPPLFALIGPQLPPAVPAPIAPIVPVKPPVPTLGPPAVAQRESVQARPQPPTRSTPEASGVVRSAHPFLPEDRPPAQPPPQPQSPPQPQFPPPRIEADWYAPTPQSASDWLNVPSSNIEDNDRTNEASASFRSDKRRLPPARPVPSASSTSYAPPRSPLPNKNLYGKIAVVLENCSSDNAGYLSLLQGERLEIRCTAPELGDPTDSFQYYIFGQKVSRNEEGWFPYSQDVIRVDETPVNGSRY